MGDRDVVRIMQTSQASLQSGEPKILLRVKGKDRPLRSSDHHMCAMARVCLHVHEHTNHTHTYTSQGSLVVLVQYSSVHSPVHSFVNPKRLHRGQFLPQRSFDQQS